DEIRTVLLSSRDCAMLPETEVLLLAASRAQLVRSTIQPALARGEVVICDRYVDSTLAYQGGGRQMPMVPLLSIQAYATGGLKPDIRLLLDLPVTIGLQRRFADPGTVNRIDNDGVAFHERVRAAYLDLVLKNPNDWIVIDASAPFEDVARDIAAAISDRIK
ncbi:MAG: dTMP kinase, partial [Thermomicrobiales bacterium]